MTADRPLRFGVLGAGRIAAQQFVPALRTVPGVTLAAAASRDLDRARALQPERAYDDYAALLDDAAVDAVYIATHNGLHRDLALAALERGKHVLCEKPLGRDAAECEQLAAAARRSGRHLIEAFMYRHHPQITRVSDLVADGAIGALRVVEAAFSFHLTKPDDVRLNKAWGGGALLDVGCYCVNACRLFLGDAPSSVDAVAHFHPRHEVDLSLHGTLDYGDGRFGVISCGFDAGLRQHLVLCGTGGTITLDRPFLSWNGPPTARIADGQGERTIEFPAANPFAAEIADLADAVGSGRRPLLGPDEGLHNARIMDALASSALGRPLPDRR